MNELNMDKYVKAQSILCEYKDYPNEVDGDDVSESVSLFLELILEYERLDKALNRACEMIKTSVDCPCCPIEKQCRTLGKPCLWEQMNIRDYMFEIEVKE